MRVRNAREETRITGVEELEGKVNYLIGRDPAKWHTNLPTYGKVAYSGVLPGVDLVFHGRGERLEYDFEIAPGADPRMILVELGDRGWTSRLDRDGTLVTSSKDVSIRFDRPVAYQIAANGMREIVETEYTLKSGNRVGFHTGRYDKTRKLVIDPVPIMIYSTLLGGSGSEWGLAVAIDRFGNAYVTGSTNSTNFPVQNAYDSACGTDGNCNSGLSDAFITKFNSNGTGVIYSTYIGGSGSEQGNGIAVDHNGAAYITGSTTSTDFPITVGAIQATCGPGYTIDPVTCALTAVSSCQAGNYPDAFAAELSSDGTTLVYSTYLGGSLDDYGTGIAVDSAGEAYITGRTQSYTNIAVCNGSNYTVGLPYPTSAHAYLPGSSVTSGAGIYHAFFTKLSATGALLYSTNLGFGQTGGNAVAIDGAGNGYITGSTTDANFPTTLTAVQKTCSSCPSQPDAFVARIAPTKSGAASLTGATFLGGPGADSGAAIALDPTNAIYVTGSTGSNPGFPTTAGTLQPASPKPSGSPNPSAFVTKLNPSVSKLLFSTYMGGSNGSDYGYGIVADPNLAVYVTGVSSSTDFPLDTVNLIPIFPEPSGGLSAPFLSRLNTQGSRLLPGQFRNNAMNYQPVGGLALDFAGNGYVVGTVGIASGSNFVTTPGAFESVNSPALGTLSGNNHLFLEKTSMTDILFTPSLLGFTPSAPQPVGQPAPPLSFTMFNNGIAHLVLSSISIVGPNASDFTTQTSDCFPYVKQQSYCTVTVTFTPGAPGFRQAQVKVADSQPGPQYIQLTGFGQ
jgi:Beta-propeller repeat